VLIGAAAGAAITYILMTRKSGNPIQGAAQDFIDNVESGADKVTSGVSDTMEDATQAVKDAARKVTK
jgi:hypothetical protein